MSLYLGSNKYKLHIGSSALVLATIKNLINGIAFKSSDGKIMKTSDGLYLTVKENN